MHFQMSAHCDCIDCFHCIIASCLSEIVCWQSSVKQASRAQILDKATEYIQYMRRKNHTHQQDIDDLKKQNALLEQQGMYTLRTEPRAEHRGTSWGLSPNSIFQGGVDQVTVVSLLLAVVTGTCLEVNEQWLETTNPLSKESFINQPILKPWPGCHLSRIWMRLLYSVHSHILS